MPFHVSLLNFPVGYVKNLLKLTKLVHSKICLDFYHIDEKISPQLQFPTKKF